MVGVTRRDNVRKENLIRKTHAVDIIHEIKIKKSRWAGHLARSKDYSWTHNITNWPLRTQTIRRGRQRRRWMDDIR